LQVDLGELDRLLQLDSAPQGAQHLAAPEDHGIEALKVAPLEPVGAVHIERARSRVQELLTMEHSFGGTRVASLAVDSARAFGRRIATAGVRPRYRSEAHAAAAELYEVSGWLLVDTAHPDDVDRANNAALRHARAAGDHSMVTFVRQNESMHLCQTGRETEALDLARGVLEQNLSPRISSLFHVREARALGVRGDSEAEKLWQQAIAEYGDGARDSDPYWSWWIDDQQMRWFEAALRDDLGQHDRAINLWQEYLAIRSNDLYFSLSLANLARSQTHAGAWADAESTVNHLIDDADEIHSGRAIVIISALNTDVAKSSSAPRSLRDATHALASFTQRACADSWA
jgi:hypothetical protein